MQVDVNIIITKFVNKLHIVLIRLSYESAEFCSLSTYSVFKEIYIAVGHISKRSNCKEANTDTNHRKTRL